MKPPLHRHNSPDSIIAMRLPTKTLASCAIWAIAALLTALPLMTACEGGEIELAVDPDGDGVPNALEEVWGTDPQRADTDGDGLSDLQEIEELGTTPTLADTDADGASDGLEVELGTDPLDADSDDGGVEDGEEIAFGRDPLNSFDDIDADEDGLTDAEEAELGTDPDVVDTDFDGLTDYEEVRESGSDPRSRDTDGDALNDRVEFFDTLTDPLRDDTDGDTLSDGEEVLSLRTDPLQPDTDGDALRDDDEVARGTDPLDADSDDDSLDDGVEVLELLSDPLLVDTDGDFLSDPRERASGTDPNEPDTDNDGLDDGPEVDVHGTEPLVADTDLDRLEDGFEVLTSLTSPLTADSDGDGLEDGREVLDLSTDPNNVDTDGEGIDDGREVDGLGTDPLLVDTDGDTLDDLFEVESFFTDPLDPDTDDDRLSDGEEHRLSTNPNITDTDLGGVIDGDEVAQGRNPLDPSDDGDSDRDGIPDAEEILAGTDPNNADSDSDGLADLAEVNAGSNPLVADTDGDGLEDGPEVHEHGSNPTRVDTDFDELTDFQEVNETETDPAMPDTDLDGLNDGPEVTLYQTDPLDADSDDDTLSDGVEVFSVGSSPNDSDSDDDGLVDADEFVGGTNPQRADTDQDGLSDIDEIAVHRTNPLLSDTDQDGIADGVELMALEGLVDIGPTDPLDIDTDNDGMRDGLELAYGVNPLVVDTDEDGIDDGSEAFDYRTDPSRPDTDLDGLTDGAELVAGTDALVADTDADGVDDGEEVNGRTITLASGEIVVFTSEPLLRDTDDDGLTDLQELRRFQTNPRERDSDGDTLTDREEVDYGFNPMGGADGVADPDDDGLSSREEFDAGTSPIRPDSDHDGLSDGDELLAGTDPLYSDTDGDTLSDGAEVQAGSNPLATDSDLDGIADEDEREALVDIDGDGFVATVDPDQDNDGLLDADEVRMFGTDERKRDTDGDQISDGLEVGWGLDPLQAGDALEDADDDGLSNLDEARRGTDATLADTDADGLPDGVEVARGLNPLDGQDASDDFDGDGITNYDEVCPLGVVNRRCAGASTDARGTDSDGDGLADSVDDAPADPDRDGDGLLDGDEVYVVGSDPDLADSDFDGVSDADEFEDGSDVVSVDRDGDALRDDLERLAGTDPNVVDTDNDGLNDYIEYVRGLMLTTPAGARVQVFSDPLVADTDGDGLLDGLEASWGTDPTSPDTDSDGLTDREERDLETDPLATDSDFDGVPDGVDPSPVEQDADGDGLPDAAELVDGFNARIVDVEAAGDWSGTLDIGPLQGARFRVAAIVRPTALSPGSTEVPPVVVLEAGDQTSSGSTRWEGARLIASAVFATTESTLAVNVFGGEGTYVERVFVERLDSSAVEQLSTVGTFADRFDSDGDGLDDRSESGSGVWADVDGDAVPDRFERGAWVDVDGDGVAESGEAARSFWFEAEHFAPASVDRVNAANASGGSAVVVLPGDARDVLFGAGGSWGYTPGVRYGVFLRAKVASDSPSLVDDPGCDPEDCPNFAWITVDRGNSPVNDCAGESLCASRVALTNSFEWRYAGSYTPGDAFTITVRELLGADVRWELDQVAILPVDFSPNYDVAVPVSSIPAALRVEGISSGTMYLDLDLPWGVSNAMEADTDGDGYRSSDAQCVVSSTCPTGVIDGTSGWLTDGFELRTLGSNPFDIDSDRDADLYPSRAGSWFGDAVADLFAGVVRYDDAHDPFPVSLDRDLDGLDNALEEGLWAACQSGDPSCVDDSAAGVTCVNALPGSGQVLCWAADDDRDNDGVPDGQEDRNQDGLVSAGETDPNDADSDGDGISDGVEQGLATPRSRNTAADALAAAFVGDVDGATRTNPLSPDSDGDGLCDAATAGASCVLGEDINTNGAYEPSNCLGFRSTCGDIEVVHPTTGDTLTYSTPARAACETDASAADSDGDGLSDRMEVLVLCSDPSARDSDADGVDDRIEVRQLRTDPNTADTDGDGLLDGEEYSVASGQSLSDPLSADTDGDGLNDNEELMGEWPSDPWRIDTDGDGLTDFAEVNGSVATDPSRFDSDGDGLSDLRELFGEDRNQNGVLDVGEDLNGNGALDVIVTNPNNVDSDGDGFRDGEEVRGGSDPNDGDDGPSSLDDAGGLSVGIDDANVERELDGSGAPTGVITVTGAGPDGTVALSCPGRPTTAFVDGALIIDRSDPARQRVFVDGDFHVRLPGNESVNLWSGRTEIIGADDEGRPTNTAVAYTPAGASPNPFALGGEVAADISFRGGAFFDICEGEIGGLADWRLGNDDWALVAGSELAVRPSRLGMESDGQIGFDTPIGPIYLVNAALEVNLLDFYASGRAGLEVPGLGDLLNLFPRGDSVDGDSSDCPVCLEFEVDVLNGRFAFRPQSGYAMSIGPIEVSVEGPSMPMPEFEIDISRGYVFLTAAFGMRRGLEFEGSVEFDMAGQIEFEPASVYEPRSCGDTDDCLYGQACIEGACVGCASRFEPVIASRVDVGVEGAGDVADQYEIVVEGQRFTCPGGGSSCAAEERVKAETFRRTFQATQTGRYDARELADALADAVNAGANSGCGDACDDGYRDCAILECGLQCGFDTFGVDCGSCADPVCAPIRSNCTDACADAIEVEAFVNDEVITIESDTLLTELDVTVLVNGTASDDFTVDIAELVNGNLLVVAAVTVPLKIPTLSLTMGGALFVDAFPTAEDADPVFAGLNGEVSLGAGFGPVSMGVRLGGAAAQASFDERDELDFINFAVDGGLTLDSFASGLPGGLGSIGTGGGAMLVGYDVGASTLCGEGQFNFGPWEMPIAFNFVPPINPVTDEFDTSFGGMDASFQLSLPLLDVARANGVAAIGWDGDFLFAAELELELLPGIPLANAGFELSTERARVYGLLELPGGLGRLSADGELEWNGQFDLSLEGSLTPLGFELANVSGRVNNSGVELAANLSLPGGLAVVDVQGWVRDSGEFFFQGQTSISIPGGTTLSNATVRLSNDGLSIRANLRIPGVTEISVIGEVTSDGYVYLAGSGSIGIGDAVRVGPISLSFERQTNGVVTIEGSGAVSIAGMNIAELEFSISTTGAFSARGRIDLWVATVDVFIEKSAGGSVSFSARAAFDISVLSHSIYGTIELGYARGALYFELAGGVSGPVINFSLSLRVDTNGCFSVGGLGRVCL